MARQGLLAFTRYTFPRYRPAPHHHLIAETLEAVERGEKKRVMIFMPPRHGKSELASRRFPAFFIGRNPERSIIAASYNKDLASDFGRDVRNIVADYRYSNLFDVHLSEDSSAANRWHTQKGGMYVAAGVGTAATGRGAHAFLIDDPVKDRETADSEVFREKIWRWYTSVAYTRLESDIDPNEVLEDDWLWKELRDDIDRGDATPMEGAILLIQTRWNDDDLAGRLLKEQKRGGDQWEILELPAIREVEGERTALWASKYPLPALERIKNAVGQRDWEALYQQKPITDEGAIFKRHWWKPWDPPNGRYPPFDYIVASADTAYTEKEQNDPTGFVVLGVWKDKKDGLNKVMLMQAWRKRLEIIGEDTLRLPNESEADWIKRTRERWGLCEWIAYSCKRWGVHKLLVEGKASGLSVLQAIRKLHMNDGFSIEAVPVKGDKTARAYAVQQAFTDGLVYAPDREWAEMVREEMASFPLGPFNDLTDAMTHGLKHIRDKGLILRKPELEMIERERALYRPQVQPVYEI